MVRKWKLLTMNKTISLKILTSRIASCLCGGVKIKVAGKMRHVINCHCKQCMKTHGNYSAYTACPEKNLKFINNKTLKWFQSSSFAKRGFCFKCGASIFYKLIESDNISIAAGMFDYPTKLKTNSNIFIKDKLDYYKLDRTLLTFQKFSK